VWLVVGTLLMGRNFPSIVPPVSSVTGELEASELSPYSPFLFYLPRTQDSFSDGCCFLAACNVDQSGRFLFDLSLSRCRPEG